MGKRLHLRHLKAFGQEKNRVKRQEKRLGKRGVLAASPGLNMNVFYHLFFACFSEFIGRCFLNIIICSAGIYKEQEEALFSSGAQSL